MEHVFRVLRPSTPLTESMTNRNSAEDEQSFGKIMEKMDLLPSEPLPSPESENQQFPRNHPLSGSKHLCAICEDRASGKHYGVYSCEGCKGFFKRTVRKDLVYACRDEKKCIVDKRQRNRCQYCRYQKCLSCGMKREAVQEEKQRGHKRMEDLATTSSTTVPGRLLMDAFSQADERSESRTGNKMIPYLRSANSSAITREDGALLSHLCDVINNQLYQMVEFACQLQYFTFLRRPDQILLLKSCWLELLVVNVSYRTMDLLGSEDIAPKRPKDTKPQQLGVGPSLIVHRSKAQRAGVQVLFDRILAEVCVKMKRLSITKAEVQCLKGIILFNPDIRDLADRYNVGCSREAIYENLTEHCRINYPLNDARFGQLLLLLPPIRSISIRCRDHLFFFRLTGEKPIEKYFSDLIETILDIRN